MCDPLMEREKRKYGSRWGGEGRFLKGKTRRPDRLACAMMDVSGIVFTQTPFRAAPRQLSDGYPIVSVLLFAAGRADHIS